MTRIRIFAALAPAVLALAACGAPTGPTQEDPDRGITQGVGGIGGDDVGRIGDIFAAQRAEERSGGAIFINKYLWQASLDTLSFMPLASTDPFSGVIATDWAQVPGAVNERFKVTAYVSNTALEAASLRVAVFREVLDEDGRWVTAPASGDTARRIEDLILTRARQIKVAELEAAGG